MASSRATPELLGLTPVPLAAAPPRTSRPKPAPKSKTTMINPAEWLIRKGFALNGVSYSRGEPVPEMSERDADQLRGDGQIAMRGAKGAQETRFARPPENTTDYMRGPDLVVLQRIRAHPPTVAELEEMVELAKRGRTQLFREALNILLELTRTIAEGQPEKPPPAAP